MKALDYSLPWGRKGEDIFTQDWDDFQQDIHKSRLKHMKPEVKKFMSSPKEGLSMKTRAAKRKAIKRARYLDIELENRVLLNKLSHLMRHPAEIYETMSKKKVGPRSLNKITRQKEYKRVNRENEKLVSRIERNKGEYNRKTWAKERRQNEQYLKNMSRYDKNGNRKTLRFSKKNKRMKRDRSMAKNRLRKKWARSLPPVHGSSSEPNLEPQSVAQSLPSPMFHMTTGVENGIERDIGIKPPGASSHHSPPQNAGVKREERIPDNTKIYEIGRNLSGVFTILSASTRGKMLVIQAYVPSDQVTVEKLLSVHDVQVIMSDRVELLKHYRREELCKALIERVTFFFRDGKRVLLIEQGKKKSKKTKAVAESKNDDKRVSPGKEKKSKRAASSKPQPGSKQSERKKAAVEKNNAEDDIGVDKHSSKFIIKMPQSAYKGMFLMCQLYDYWQLVVYDVKRMNKTQSRLPPGLSEQLKSASMTDSRRLRLVREYLVEEQIVEKPESRFCVKENRKKGRDGLRERKK